MSNAKHTPGPWRVSSIEGAYVLTDAPVELSVLVASTSMPEIQLSECEANARLIAAAPELLGLAKRVAALNRDAGEIGAGMLASIVDEARAAIAKAEGQK